MNFNTTITTKVANLSQEDQIKFLTSLSQESLMTILYQAQAQSRIELRLAKLPKLNWWSIVTNYKEIIAFIEFVIDVIKDVKTKIKELLDKYKDENTDTNSISDMH